jgi:myo-inositol-1(or 4)-monophosphatase
MTRPDDQAWAEFTRFAEHLAIAAGAQSLPLFRTRPDMANKLSQGFDPVTEADRAGERIMRAMIEETYPDHGIIGEEYGPKAARSGFTWVLDPIDGTRSFVTGMLSWTTLVGLSYEGEPTVGVAAQPYVGERFIGSPSGAVVKTSSGERAIRVQPAATLSQAIGTTTAPGLYRSARQRDFLNRMRQTLRFIRYDGDAYFFCLLAAGQIDIALDAGLEIYDIAPLVPIIRGAGGVVSRWDRKPAHLAGDIIAAASPALYEEALALLDTCAA